MLSTFDWQLVHCIVVQHLCYAVERLTELSQDETTVIVYDYLHVHETRRTPASSGKITIITAVITTSTLHYTTADNRQTSTRTNNFYKTLSLSHCHCHCLSLSPQYNGHLFTRYQNISLLDFIEAWLIGVELTTGVIRRAKLQSNHHQQQTSIRLLTCRICPHCQPTVSKH